MSIPNKLIFNHDERMFLWEYEVTLMGLHRESYPDFNYVRYVKTEEVKENGKEIPTKSDQSNA